MRRIAIIGCGGTGKSTLAARMGERLDLPVVHLDSMFWKANWIPTPGDIWRRIVVDLTNEDAWIIDGNYGSTMDVRLSAADTVIFLDRSRFICLLRVAKRRVTYLGRTRPDMAAGCRERLSWKYLKWIWTYRSTSTPRILAKLRELPAGKRAVVLRSRRSVSTFLAGLSG